MAEKQPTKVRVLTKQYLSAIQDYIHRYQCTICEFFVCNIAFPLSLSLSFSLFRTYFFKSSIYHCKFIFLNFNNQECLRELDEELHSSKVDPRELADDLEATLQVKIDYMEEVCHSLGYFKKIIFFHVIKFSDEHFY
jgi:hypothetical protein